MVYFSCSNYFDSCISSYQKKSQRFRKLKEYTKPKCKVIRNGTVIEIKTEELVLGDSLLLKKGIQLQLMESLNPHDFQ
jgi:Ca2+-transporting ATPase